jgi:Rrf2 family protein
MQLTRAADYAVRVMIHFGACPPGARITRTALAKATGVPEDFLAKVLQALARAGLVLSRRGLDGGFVLRADSTKISLVDVIEAIDGPMAVNVCLMSGNSCERQGECPAHTLWGRAQTAMLKVLRSASIADLAAQAAANRKRRPAAVRGDT